MASKTEEQILATTNIPFVVPRGFFKGQMSAVLEFYAKLPDKSKAEYPCTISYRINGNCQTMVFGKFDLFLEYYFGHLYDDVKKTYSEEEKDLAVEAINEAYKLLWSGIAAYSSPMPILQVDVLKKMYTKYNLEDLFGKPMAKCEYESTTGARLVFALFRFRPLTDKLAAKRAAAAAKARGEKVSTENTEMIPAQV